MKNIKNIFIATLFIFILSSCGDEDNIFEFVGDETTKIVGTLSTTQTIINQVTDIEFEYTLPQSFPNDAILQIKGLYGVANEVISEITIPAGETTGVSTISLSGDDIGFAGQIYKVEMSGIRLVNFEDVEDEDGNTVNLPIPTGDDNFEISSNIIEVLVHQNYEVGMANVSLGWDDGSDLDIRLRNSNGDLITNAETGANPEVITLDDTLLPDGDYTLGVVYFATADDSLNYTFKIRLSDGSTQIVQGSLSGYVESTADEINVFNVNKSGITYTITEL